MTNQEPPVRIGLDGYNMALPKGTGVATYGRNLAAAIHGLGYSLDLMFGLNIPRKVRADLRETLFFGRLHDPSPQRITWRRALRRATTKPWAQDMIEIPVSGRVLAQSRTDSLPAFDRLFNLSEIFDVCARHFRRYGRFMTLRIPDPPAIMHWSYPLPIRLAGARNIYTLHDLVPLRLPQASLEDKRYYDAVVRACVHDAAHIVTVSENSRRDILEILGADPAKVTNTYQASTMPPSQDEAGLAVRLKRLFDLDLGGYLLFIGAIEPKKNLGRLIEAYLEADIETPFIIVGGEGWNADRELKLLHGGHGTSLAGASRIRRIDHLPRPMLADLLRGARAMLFPALYEGFGLPALEALGCGVPVLSSTTGALPEVVGDAAIAVDPYDTTAIARALRRLDGDEALRRKLAAAGMSQAQHFSAERFQERMKSVYQTVLAS
jgi:glycosyltransferase involved in cell wall biosynthesis